LTDTFRNLSVVQRRSAASSAPRLAAGAFVTAGVLFAVYPVLRPFSSERGLEGAAAFASARWVIAHSAAMVGFVLLCLGFLGLHDRLRATPGGALSSVALALGWAGTGLTLPFYGAEAFALHALGTEVMKRNDPTLTGLADKVRFGPGFAFIVVGLLGLAAATVLFAVAMARSGWAARWAGVPLASAMVLYLPQFAAGQLVRVAHGLLMTAGCVTIALALLGKRDQRVVEVHEGHATPLRGPAASPVPHT
jgi:hypothetical protein